MPLPPANIEGRAVDVGGPQQGIDYSTSVCPACEAGYHEDPSQKLVFKCTCPCHG
jgi:hypothetical protein